MDEENYLAMLSALSQETRLRAVRYLVRCGPEGATAGQVGEHVEAASSRASFHLSALENAGLVTSRRQSRNIVYTANVESLGNLMSFLLNDCCDNHPGIRACCERQKDCC